MGLYLKFRVSVNSKRILGICKLTPCKMHAVTEKLVVEMLSSHVPDVILLEPHPLCCKIQARFHMPM